MIAEPIAGVSRYRRLALGDVGSTNDEAFAAARTGDPGDLWVTARSQSKGKARRGRSWVSVPGNLYASLLLIDPAEMPKLATLPLVAALAVFRCLKPYADAASLDLAIKWPNDVLLNGAKINGVLLESELLDSGTNAVVIGCGINCESHPENAMYPTTSLLDMGVRVAADQLFQNLAVEMKDVLEIWNRGRGFSAVRSEWLAAAHGIGQIVSVNMADSQLSGIFEALDEDGYLKLRDQAGKLLRISAGDLFFPNDAGGSR